MKILIYNLLTKIVSTEIAESTLKRRKSYFCSDIKMSHTLILDEEIAFGNIILSNDIQV